MKTENEMEKIVALCKRRGFIFQGSEIYGGLAGTWDYGPLGSIFKKNLKDWWWKDMVQERDDIVGLDAAIMMNPRAWEASGHVAAFTDPLVECKVCNKRFRSDKPDEIKNHENSHKEKVEWTEPKNFNLLIKAYVGVTEDTESQLYLRGEITNGVQVNFKNVVDSTRHHIQNSEKSAYPD
jgi:glycyl-tRNA synthetase